MLAIEALARELGALPILTRVGLAVLVLGGLVDLVAHVALDVVAHVDVVGEAPAHGHGFTPAESAAHLVVFVGMVLVLAGVVVDGVRRTRPGRSAGNHTSGGT